MVNPDTPGLEEATEAAWAKWEDAFTEFWSQRSDFQDDRPDFDKAIRAAYPIIAAAVREQVASEIEYQGQLYRPKSPGFGTLVAIGYAYAARVARQSEA